MLRPTLSISSFPVFLVASTSLVLGLIREQIQLKSNPPLNYYLFIYYYYSVESYHLILFAVLWMSVLVLRTNMEIERKEGSSIFMTTQIHAGLKW